jgi:hypothetical protein
MQGRCLAAQTARSAVYGSTCITQDEECSAKRFDQGKTDHHIAAASEFKSLLHERVLITNTYIWLAYSSHIMTPYEKASAARVMLPLAMTSGAV